MPAQYKTQDPSNLGVAGLRMATEGASRIGAATTTTTTRDGNDVNYGQIGIGLAQAAMGIYSQFKAAATEKAAEFYQKEVEKDPNFRPDFQSKDMDMKAWNLMRLRMNDVRTSEAEYQKNDMQVKKMKYDLKHETLRNAAQEANALWTTNRKGSLKKYEFMYEQIDDGTDVVFGDDDMSYTVTGPDGVAQEPVRFASTDAMKAHLDQLYKQVATPQDFAKTAMSVQQAIYEDNTKAALTPIAMVNKDGTRATMYKGFRDPATGRATGNKYELDGKEVSEDAWKKLGMTEVKPAEDYAKLENLGKTGAGIDAETKLRGAQTGVAGAQKKNIEAETEKTQAEKDKIVKGGTDEGIDLKNAAPETKLAHGMSSILGIPLDEAMRVVLNKKEQSAVTNAKLEIAAAALKQTGWDTTDPDFVKAIQALGIEELVGAKKKPEKGPGLGVAETTKASAASAKSGAGASDKPAKAITEAEVIDNLGAQFPDAPEGTKRYLGKAGFKKTNGVWKRIS